MTEYSDSMEQRHDPVEFWEHTAPYLRYCRATSYYAQFINNYKILHGLEAEELTREDFLEFSARTDQNFQNYGEWLESVCSKCNIEVMLCDGAWNPFNHRMQSDRFRYVFRIDQLVLDVVDASSSHLINNEWALEFLDKEKIVIGGLPDYLQYVDKVMERVIERDAVAIKVGLAYHRTIEFGEPGSVTAGKVFDKDKLMEGDAKLLQDYVFNHIINRAVKEGLPVQIHTGYLHGNRNWLERGKPLKLIPLLKRFPDATFVLFHGAYPWTGEFIVLGKNYPNVILDLVWLPQLSRTAAIRTLHEILDAVPYNKICWGGDVGYIDDAAGSLEIGREVVATVLAERIEKDWISREIAEDIALHIFRENALCIYDLQDRLHSSSVPDANPDLYVQVSGEAELFAAAAITTE
jgi:hypothetical protein